MSTFDEMARIWARTACSQGQRDDIVAGILEALEDRYTLWYSAYDDRLSDDQIKDLLAATTDDDTNDAILAIEDNEAIDEARWTAAASMADEMLADAYVIELDMSRSDAERLVEIDPYEARPEVRAAIRERDDSDPFGELLHHTPAQVVRVDLDYSIPGTLEEHDDDETVMQGMAEALGLPLDTIRPKLAELLANASYGGRLQVIWQADIEDLTNKGRGLPERITFTDPSVLIMDSWNGSGWEVDLTGEVTVTVPDEGGIVLDKTERYGWAAVTGGLVGSAYAPAEVVYHHAAEQDG